MNAIVCSPLQALVLCALMVAGIMAVWYIVIDGVQKLHEELQAEWRNSQMIGKEV